MRAKAIHEHGFMVSNETFPLGGLVSFPLISCFSLGNWRVQRQADAISILEGRIGGECGKSRKSRLIARDFARSGDQCSYAVGQILEVTLTIKCHQTTDRLTWRH